MPKYKVLFTRFPYLNQEHPDVTDWLIHTVVKAREDPRFDVHMSRIADTPITMTRNRSIEQARRLGCDFLVWVDNDMAPDLYLHGDPAAKPFWDTSIEFMLDHDGPCFVAAPYCGPPPHENVYIFEWKNKESDHPNVDVELNQFTRERAAQMTGITEVAALPTGLMIMDMRAFDPKYAAVSPPYTYYEFEDDGACCQLCGQRKMGKQIEKASTEDVALTRDFSLARVKQYCNWDAWAGHWKAKCVGRPRPYTADIVSGKMRDAILADRWANEKLIVVGPQGLSRAG